MFALLIEFRACGLYLAMQRDVDGPQIPAFVSSDHFSDITITLIRQGWTFQGTAPVQVNTQNLNPYGFTAVYQHP